MENRRANIIKYCVNSKGFTLIELIIVMAVMSVLVTACFSLFYTGQNTYGSIYGDYQQQNEARIAMSFLNVKIRQNDFILPTNDHAVTVVKEPISGKNYLRVFTGPDPDDFDYIYYEGTHKSLRITQDITKAESFADDQVLIAENLDNISISSPDTDPSIITIEIMYDSGKKLTETISLRSDIN